MNNEDWEKLAEAELTHDQPQEIVCSGGIKINFGAMFGEKEKDNGE